MVVTSGSRVLQTEVGVLTIIGMSTSTGLALFAYQVCLDFRVVEQAHIMVLRVDFVLEKVFL